MFCYQRKYYSEVEVVNSVDQLDEILNDPELMKQTQACKEAHDAGDKKRYDELKRELPMFCFSAASFDRTKKREKDGTEGPLGYWRVQEAAHLNGLCVLDLDHLDKDPVFLWSDICERYNKLQSQTLYKWDIHWVFVTPSTWGLKIVFTADPEVGNLADNQAAFSKALGVVNDKSIKDASRGQFITPASYTLFIDKEKLINYYDEEYEKLFGEDYRQGSSSPKKTKDVDADVVGCHVGDDHPDGAVHSDGGADGNQPLKLEDIKYGNTPVAKIFERYTQRYGTPITGDRHRTLIKVAEHLRYLVDNSTSKLKVAIRAIPWVRQWEDKEKNAGEINDIVRDACKLPMWREIPRAVKAILPADCDMHPGGDEVAGDARTSADQADSREIWDRLQPLLEGDPLYAVCTAHLPDENKMAGIFAAGGMFCTLATRVHYLHYDGRQHRMNPQVTIIGEPASGKSFVDDLDEAIMSIMRAADEPGRRAEREYKKEQKKRRTSNKAAKGEQQLKEPEECIRYIPSRTSNAVFYRRQQNAKEMVEGEVIPLHLYTFDSELDSSVTAQSGGTWIGKHDLELKAFHNEKSGVDYANADSVNEVITVFWNQVITGTDVSLAKKINMRNINDGLCSRIAIIRMTDDEFSMIDKGQAKQIDKTFVDLQKWGEFFDKLKGELFIPKLVNHVYDLCEKAANVAKAKDDKVLNYFRKRAVFYAEWFTIPRILARHWLENKDKKNFNIMKPVIKKSDLDFAELVFDTVIYYQDLFFGKMLEDCWQNGKNEFAVRRQLHTSRNEGMFDTLPKEFSVNVAAKILNINYSAASSQLNRWAQRNMIVKEGKGVWKKVS